MFQSWLRKKGVRHETSAPHTPQQNGVAERDNRTIVEAARTYLYANRAFPLELWAEAVHCAIYVLNRVLSSTCTVITLYEAWYKRKPDVSTLGIFGSYVYILIQKEDRRKLDPKGTFCIYLANSDASKSFRCWDPLSRKIKTSRDVIFLDQCVSRLASPSSFNQPDNQPEMDVSSSYKDQISSIND